MKKERRQQRDNACAQVSVAQPAGLHRWVQEIARVDAVGRAGDRVGIIQLNPPKRHPSARTAELQLMSSMHLTANVM